jgi:transposase
MSGYITGMSRAQSTLFPESLDEYLPEDNPVRVVDCYVDSLDLADLGFKRSVPNHTGRPAYSPAMMLKLYIYGYLNRIQTSRRLERECQRNIELMWLIQRLTPDFKTIADFRKDNATGIRNTCKSFVQLCRQMNLFTESLIAIDGSKFKATNNPDKNFTKTTIKRKIDRTEQHIDDYLEELDKNDELEDVQDDGVPLKDKIEQMKEHLKKLKALEQQVEASPDQQVSLTDPDCRAMKTGVMGRVIGYNVQTAVDTKHHLIVAHEVTNARSDRAQLYPMGSQVQAVLGKVDVTLLADKGYCSGESIKQVHEAGMNPLVPRTHRAEKQANGLFNKGAFNYKQQQDAYTCPGGRELAYSCQSLDKGRTFRVYGAFSTCKGCAVKSQCTAGSHRRIRRWENENLLDDMEARLKSKPDSMHIRKCTAEHPFGTIKSWTGSQHFVTRGLKSVNTEMDLNVLAYNLKRMMNIMGPQELMAAIKA